MATPDNVTIILTALGIENPAPYVRQAKENPEAAIRQALHDHGVSVGAIATRMKMPDHVINDMVIQASKSPGMAQALGRVARDIRGSVTVASNRKHGTEEDKPTMPANGKAQEEETFPLKKPEQPARSKPESVSPSAKETPAVKKPKRQPRPKPKPASETASPVAAVVPDDARRVETVQANLAAAMRGQIESRREKLQELWERAQQAVEQQVEGKREQVENAGEALQETRHQKPRERARPSPQTQMSPEDAKKDRIEKIEVARGVWQRVEAKRRRAAEREEIRGKLATGGIKSSPSSYDGAHEQDEICKYTFLLHCGVADMDSYAAMSALQAIESVLGSRKGMLELITVHDGGRVTQTKKSIMRACTRETEAAALGATARTVSPQGRVAVMPATAKVFGAYSPRNVADFKCVRALIAEAGVRNGNDYEHRTAWQTMRDIMARRKLSLQRMADIRGISVAQQFRNMVDACQDPEIAGDFGALLALIAPEMMPSTPKIAPKAIEEKPLTQREKAFIERFSKFDKDNLLDAGCWAALMEELEDLKIDARSYRHMNTFATALAVVQRWAGLAQISQAINTALPARSKEFRDICEKNPDTLPRLVAICSNEYIVSEFAAHILKPCLLQARERKAIGVHTAAITEDKGNAFGRDRY